MNQEKLVLIGASALGRETFCYAQACGMTVKGFLDSRARVLDSFEGYPPIISSVEEYEVAQGDVFVCAIGETEARRRYVEAILSKGGKFVSVIHPSAIVGINVVVGKGCIVRPFAVIGNDVSIGEHVIIGTQSLVAHDCKVGDYVTISPGSHVAGWCRIEDGAFLGIHSATVPHVSLGENVVVAAGAVVVANVESGRVMGIPARAK